jgi:hypothetical protein
MRNMLLTMGLGMLVSAAAPAQSASAPAASAPAASSPAPDHPAAWQIAAAVLPLPDSMRAGAAVLGYREGKLVRLRPGTNEMICLADNPSQKGFEASCYHKALDPFMARGRALRAAGVKDRHAIDSLRLADIRAGRFSMPKGPTMLASLFAESDSFDPSAGRPEKSSMLHVIYLPYATEASSGISAAPAKDRPWLMYGGKPWAHVMLP